MSVATDPRLTPLFHGSCLTHQQYGMDCNDYTDLRRDHGDRCRLCGATHAWMSTDHDHELGMGAVRGLLCPRCNTGHMRRIDWGERAIDDRTREYLINPWYLARHGLTTAHDPRVHVSVRQLSAADQIEVDRLRRSGHPSPYRMRKAAPRFEHRGVAACLAAGDIRPAMRLVWMVDSGLLDTDIARPLRARGAWV